MQPDSLIPNLTNPQNLNRFGYVLNNPIRFNDPTGHWECDFDLDECAFLQKHNSGNGIPITLPKDKSGSQALYNVGTGKETNDDLGSSPDLSDEDFDLFTQILNQPPLTSTPFLDPFSDPFGFEERLIYCQNNICDVRIGILLGEYRFDWRRVDLNGLFLDIASLTLSVMSLPPVSKAVGINTKLERQTIQSLNAATESTGVLNDIGSGEGMDLYITGIGLIFPLLNIPSSAGAVINDLSEGFYFVPMSPCMTFQYNLTIVP